MSSSVKLVACPGTTGGVNAGVTGSIGIYAIGVGMLSAGPLRTDIRASSRSNVSLWYSMHCFCCCEIVSKYLKTSGWVSDCPPDANRQRGTFLLIGDSTEANCNILGVRVCGIGGTYEQRRTSRRHPQVLGHHDTRKMSALYWTPT